MITKKNIDQILAMPDEQMAAMLRLLLGGTGVDTSQVQTDPKSLRKIRALLEEVTDADLERVSVLLERYRRGG